MLGRIMLGVAVIVSTGFAAPSRYATPVHDNTPVSAAKTRAVNEAPLFVVGTSDHLVVLQATAERVQVRDAQGCVGWIDAMEVSLSTARVKHVLESAEVDGRLDEPSMIWIPGIPAPGDDALALSRSFSAEVRENVDKESLQRLAE